MQTTLSNQALQAYFVWFKHMNKDIKKMLIAELTHSLKEDLPSETKKSFFGTWQGEETAEQILETIYAERYIERNTEQF